MQSLRLLALAAIVGYFAFLWWPSAGSTTPAPATPATSAPQVLTPLAPQVCTSNVQAATLGLEELRLTVTGTANTLNVRWKGGTLSTSTELACSGGECRIKLPPNPQGVAAWLDQCPAVEVN